MVEVEHPKVVEVSLRGMAMYGNIASPQEIQDLRVNYRCLESGSTPVYLTIPLFDSFEPLMLGWMKQCSKDEIGSDLLSDQIDIDFVPPVDPLNLDSVVRISRPQLNWMIQSSSVVVIPKSARKATFLVSASSNQRQSHFSQPIVSVYPLTILHTTVTGDARLGAAAGYSDPKSFDVNFFCKRNGRVNVTVSIHQPSLTVDFSFIKDCGNHTRSPPPSSFRLLLSERVISDSRISLKQSVPRKFLLIGLRTN